MKKGYSLSICIPTRNRASFLKKSIESIVSCEFFTNHHDIEIIVSDNASVDDTESVVKEFIKIHGERIKYFRNQIDVKDGNFEIALRYGQGDFLKLINDSVLWRPNTLENIYQSVKKYSIDKATLFWLNGMRPDVPHELITANLDEFIKNVSFYMSWIGSFGIWREQLEGIPDLSDIAKTYLVQVHVLLLLISKNPVVVINNQNFFKVQDVGAKGGYSIAKVYGQNYLSMLAKYSDQISKENFAYQKKSVLQDHILPYYFHQGHNFYLYPLEEDLDAVYLDEDYYKPLVQSAREKWLKDTVRESVSGISIKLWFKISIAKFILRFKPRHLKSLARLWKFENRHNNTSIVNQFDFSKVTVGRYSYGPLNVLSWGRPGERLTIGSFVSISNDVRFILGGNHQTSGLSTFPFKSIFLDAKQESTTKGPIVIKDDVWIGYGATILSGITINQGAVIAAGAVVVSDVPAYAVVAGNPAKVVKYRFAPDIIERLRKVDFDRLSIEQVVSFPHLIYSPVDETNINHILEKFRLI